MRTMLACIFGVAMIAHASDPGVPPRAASTDYPVHGPAESATIAAAIVPANQVSKMFSSGISKDYIVVEVAIYPENGVPFDAHLADFSLRVGQRIGRADIPLDVAPWPDRRAPGIHSPVDVTTEVGVAHENENDPVYGRQHSTETYTGVAVSAPGHDNLPPPPDPRVDPRIVQDKVQRMALAEGDTKVAIAGYLYFPQYAKRKKSDEVELRYAKDLATVNLVFPKQ
jgi:hypothetical protein